MEGWSEKELRRHRLPSEGRVNVVQQRIRLHFSKQGNLCFIGHRDLMRTMERLMRRARMPLAMSQGFHPKPRVSYYGALSLGFSSQDEVMELVLEGEHEIQEILARLNAASVPGLEFYDPELIVGSTFKIKAVSFDYETYIPERLREGLAARVAEIMTKDTVPVTKTKGREVDLKRSLLMLTFQEDKLLVRLAVVDGPEATMREVLAVLGLDTELFRSLFPKRTKTNLA